MAHVIISTSAACAEVMAFCQVSVIARAMCSTIVGFAVVQASLKANVTATGTSWMNVVSVGETELHASVARIQTIQVLIPWRQLTTVLVSSEVV